VGFRPPSLDPECTYLTVSSRHQSRERRSR